LWEEVTEELIITEKHALNMCIWLSNRFSMRSTARALPEGMPDMVDDLTVETRKDGKDSLAAAMKDQPNVLQERSHPQAIRLRANRLQNPKAMVTQHPGQGLTRARPKRFPNSRI
jgi:hypothetical protein